MVTFVTVLHIFVSVFLILSILLQSGKGGGMGAALGGGGAASQVFGGRGAGNYKVGQAYDKMYEPDMYGSPGGYGSQFGESMAL